MRSHSPGHREGRHHLVAYLDGLDVLPGRDYRAGKFMAHNEAGARGLVASEGVEFPGRLGTSED